MSYTLPTGKPCTAKQRREFLISYAHTMLREHRARRGSSGNDWMLHGAARARREASAIDPSPAQADMFGKAVAA